jgi:hypothetical protein
VGGLLIAAVVVIALLAQRKHMNKKFRQQMLAEQMSDLKRNSTPLFNVISIALF